MASGDVAPAASWRHQRGRSWATTKVCERATRATDTLECKRLFSSSFHLPDVHRYQRVKSHVLPTVVVGSLCQRPLPHIRTQGLLKLTISEGNHFQEITAGWRMFHHRRHLERLPEVCTCGRSVLCEIFPTRSKHFTKIATLVIHLFPIWLVG